MTDKAMGHTTETTGQGGRCGAPRRSDGAPCAQGAGAGTPHPGIGRCKWHGGSTPSHVAAAQRIQLAEAVKTYGARRDIGHLEALVELLQDSAGHCAWLRDRIQASTPDALVWGLADEVNRGSGEFPGVDVKHAAAPSVWLELYHKERRILLDVSKELARLELDWDAREALRKQGAALARVVAETCRLLGHDVNDPAVVAAFRAALKSAVGQGPGSDRVVEGVMA